IREILQLAPVQLSVRAVEALPDHRRLVAGMPVAHVRDDVVVRGHLPAMGSTRILIRGPARHRVDEGSQPSRYRVGSRLLNRAYASLGSVVSCSTPAPCRSAASST